MLRIDAADATVDNKFTDGDPAIPIPATVIDAKWLNVNQEEGVVIVLDQKISLDQTGTITNQLQDALGMKNGEQDILNNQASALDITGLVFDKTVYKAARILFAIDRQTDTQNVNEMGEMFVMHDAVADNWKLSFDSKFDNSGVILSIDSSGQVQYTSDDLSGPSYQGKIRFIDIKRLVQTA